MWSVGAVASSYQAHNNAIFDVRWSDDDSRIVRDQNYFAICYILMAL